MWGVVQHFAVFLYFKLTKQGKDCKAHCEMFKSLTNKYKILKVGPRPSPLLHVIYLNKKNLDSVARLPFTVADKKYQNNCDDICISLYDIFTPRIYSYILQYDYNVFPGCSKASYLRQTATTDHQDLERNMGFGDVKQWDLA